MAAACVPSDGFNAGDYVMLPQEGWPYGDTVSLNANAGASLALRHSDRYPYRNLWLELTQTVDSAVTLRDTVNVELCDIHGQWHGKGFGDTRQLVVRTPHKLNDGTVAVRHIMRVDTLKGIEQIGIVSGI